MSDDVKRLLAEAERAGWAMEPVARQFLAGRGVPTARFAWARTVEEALDAADAVGWPVVVKVVSPEVVHKSDVDGVIVGVSDRAALRAAWARLSGLPGFEGVLVDELVDGVEIIVGSKHDPQFGPVILVGIGGTGVEIYGDVAIRMAPLTPARATEALLSLRGHELLAGHRGAPAVDLDALAALVAAFSQVVHELDDAIASIDLNPVLASPAGAVVADARIMLRG